MFSFFLKVSFSLFSWSLFDDDWGFFGWKLSFLFLESNYGFTSSENVIFMGKEEFCMIGIEKFNLIIIDIINLILNFLILSFYTFCSFNNHQIVHINLDRYQHQKNICEQKSSFDPSSILFDKAFNLLEHREFGINCLIKGLKFV